jgi:Tfp pilus assembly protein PilX
MTSDRAVRNPTARGRPHGRRAHTTGATLPIVLLIASMMLATSAAWFEQSVAAARGAAGMYDRLLAFHAADSALAKCARNVIAGSASVMPAGVGEPAGWRSQAIFAANAVGSTVAWPAALSLHPPRCLIEAWRLVNRPDAQAYLLTARGYGRSQDSQAWLQLQLVVDGSVVERHWRRVAARPF